MLGKKKQYIITLTQTSPDVKDLVGNKSLELNAIQQLGINVLPGFVVTTTAFDDFLIANDLISFIGPRINNIDYTNADSVKKAAEEIQHTMASSVLPDMLKNPILKAYTGLSGFIESFVNVQTSVCDAQLEEKNYRTPVAFPGIKGAEALLNSIKQIWSEFFSMEALNYRAKIGFEGYLTEAVVVQKMPQAEVSGKVYTVSPLDNKQEIAEIQAIWGLDENLLGTEIIPDSYFYNKKTESITEKKIMGQDWMLVRRGRGGSDKSTIKVEISRSLQKKPKLDEKNILNLARAAATLEKHLQKPQEITWIYEAGKIYLTASKELKMQEPSMQIKTGKDFSSMLKNLDKEIADGHKQKKLAKPVESYMEEMEGFRKTEEVQGQPAAASRENITIDQDNQDKNSVEVVVVPVEKLMHVMTGKGKNAKLVFGLTHFILQDSDYENLTGDEILVARELHPEFLEKAGKARGIIIEGKVSDDLLEKLQIPVVYEVDQKTDVLNENEVITINLEGPAGGNISGQVYIGAGKKPADATAAPAAAEPDADAAARQHAPHVDIDIIGEEIPVIRSQVSQQSKPSPFSGVPAMPPAAQAAATAEQSPADKEKGAAVAEKAATAEKGTESKKAKEAKEPVPSSASSAESAEKKPAAEEAVASGIKVSSLLETPEVKEKANLPRTVTEFWQILDIANPQVESGNIDGVFVQMDSYFEFLGISRDAVLVEANKRSEFISEVIVQLKKILTDTHGKAMVLQGKENINFTDKDSLIELVKIDLAIIDKLRNRESFRNLWYALGNVKNAQEQAELKKNISSYGLRRSSTFKVYTSLAKPIAAISIKSFLDNEIDAVIIDLDKLLAEFGIEAIDGNFLEFLCWLIKTINTNKNNALLLNKEAVLTRDEIKPLLDAGLHGFILNYDNIKKLKEITGDLEVKRVKQAQKKKRGRKPKRLEYGY